jgi:hypothetical protein
MTKPLRCVFRLHDWQTHHNEAGQPYQVCARCDAYREKVTLTNTGGGPGGPA